jgi:hypothetical protein
VRQGRPGEGVRVHVLAAEDTALTLFTIASQRNALVSRWLLALDGLIRGKICLGTRGNGSGAATMKEQHAESQK